MNPLLDALSRIEYKNWRFISNGFNSFYVEFYAACAVTGEKELQQGRTWWVEDPSNEDAVIKTAFLAIEVAERHEMMESFLVDGVRPFDPHTLIADLIKLGGRQ